MGTVNIVDDPQDIKYKVKVMVAVEPGFVRVPNTYIEY